MAFSQPTYQAAVMVAQELEQHFTQHLQNARQNHESHLAQSPSLEIIQHIIDVAFWASLRREEGVSPRISLAYMSPEQSDYPLRFNHKIRMTPFNLTKLAPGVERPGIHLGVWEDEEGLFIWGTTLSIPNYCFVLDVSEPGLLVIKHRRMYGFGKFTNVAILKGDEIKLVNEDAASLTDNPRVLNALLGYDSSKLRNEHTNIMIQLAVSMRSHSQGGALLIVPRNDDQWRQSIVQPIHYELKPVFSSLSHLIKTDGEGISESLWLSSLRKEVDNISGLSAIDGATILTEDFDLLAFGAKITRREGRPQITKILFSEPVKGRSEKLVYPGQLGGTRHLSAAQFVFDQPDCLALVASQDGHFTVFSWSEHRQMVLAHRIDVLLI